MLNINNQETGSSIHSRIVENSLSITAICTVSLTRAYTFADLLTFSI